MLDSFIPATANQQDTATLSCAPGTSDEWIMKMPQTNSASEPHLFATTILPSKETECVLIFDPKEQVYVLEKLESTMSFAPMRGSSKNGGGAAAPSRGTTPTHQTPTTPYAHSPMPERDSDAMSQDLNPPQTIIPSPKKKKKNIKKMVSESPEVPQDDEQRDVTTPDDDFGALDDVLEDVLGEDEGVNTPATGDGGAEVADEPKGLFHDDDDEGM